MPKTKHFWTLILTVLLLSACNEGPQPTELNVKAQSSAIYAEDGPQTIDDLFAHVANEEVPGFAGLYFDDDGKYRRSAG